VCVSILVSLPFRGSVPERLFAFLTGKNETEDVPLAYMNQELNKIRIGRRNLGALTAFTATSRLWFDGGLWVIYWQYRGLSLFDIGLLEALLHVVCVLSDVPIGIFADRFGWKLSLSLSALLGVVYSVLSLWSHSLLFAAIAFAVRGLQITLTNGSDSSIAYESAKWAQISDRYLAISGRLFAVALVSMGVAEGVGGSLAHISWAWVYSAFSMANIASFVVVLWIREPRTSHVDPGEKRATIIEIVRNAAQFSKNSRSFVVWITLSATVSGCLATFAFYGQSLLLHAGWTLVGIGILAGAENGLGAVVSVLVDRLVKRLGVKKTISSVGLLASTGMLLFAWLPGQLAGIGYMVDSIAGNVMDPIVDQKLNEMIPKEQRATLLSANSTAFSLFMIVVFPLFGLLAQKIGLVHAAYIGSIIGAIWILSITIWWRHQQKAPDVGWRSIP